MAYSKKEFLRQLKKAQKAQQALAQLSVSERNNVLKEIQSQIKLNILDILKANKKDVQKMDQSNPKVDRLFLDRKRIYGVLSDMEGIIRQKDPLNHVIEKRIIQKKLDLQKTSVPLGVVAVIYESRPNVTLDVTALCIKSGNAIVLKGGEEAEETNKVLIRCIHKALKKKGLSCDGVIDMCSAPRSAVKHILHAQGLIDIVIPRGGRGLIDFVRSEACVPTIETGAGVCHTYVDQKADTKMAARIIENEKLTRPSVCNSLDTIVVHKKVALDLLTQIIDAFKEKEVVMHADAQAYAMLKKLQYPFLKKATQKAWSQEWLSFQCGVKVVSSGDQAIEHVREYTTRHSESVVTKDKAFAEKYLAEVDAAAIYHNASTRFTDGSCFGLGGEIGISTQKLHARGPMGLQELTTYKWVVRGKGQVRT